MTCFPQIRLRRLRQTPAIRALVGIKPHGMERLIWPVFLIPGKAKKIPISLLPDQYRYSCDRLIPDLSPLVAAGLGGIMLFGVIDEGKDPMGNQAIREDGLIPKAVRLIRREFPDLAIFTDVCLCAYTQHGHCGILDKHGNVDNDATLPQLAKMALVHAVAGADGVAPSAMMDGQVQAIRRELDNGGQTNTMIMSYSSKFASSLYGPFREAAESSPASGGRQTYQAPYDDPLQAVRESRLDIAEGADFIMVKPSLFYLDIIYRLRQLTEVPIAAYNVSGEYTMLHALSEKGGGKLEDLVRESLIALQRSGADIIITYWANQYTQLMRASI